MFPCPFRDQQWLKAIGSLDVPMWLLRVDDDGSIRFEGQNEPFAQVTGIDRFASVGKTPHDLFPDKVADAVLANYRHCVATKQRLQYDELLELPQGKVWLRTTLNPISYGDGPVQLIVGAAQDITKMKSQLGDLHEEQEVAARLFDDLRSFATLAVHDLRTPLGQIEQLIALAQRDEGLSSATRDWIDLAAQGARDARMSVESILSFVKVADLTWEKPTKVEFSSLIRSISDLVDPLEQHHITYQDCVLEAEEIVLALAVRNLVANSIHHHHKARAQVHVEICEATPGWLTLSVRDDGPGIDRTLLERSEKSKDARLGGFGLATLRKIADARGGKFWFAEVDEGTQACLTIPGSLIASEAHAPVRLATGEAIADPSRLPSAASSAEATHH